MDNLWIDKGSYWVTKSEQLSEFWHDARLCRVTASKLSGLLDHSRFSDPVKTSREITGIFRKTHTFSQKQLMERGVTVEPHARRWYSEKTGKTIKEMGLAVPKWDARFGASVDGIIDDIAICEIKVPNKMYLPLIAHRKEIMQGKKFNKYHHSHIWDSHYDQMQLGMAVTGTKICHYIVYFPSEDDIKIPQDIYHEVVFFNVKYWNSMYTEATEKYDKLIVPLMKEYGLVRIDPC